MADIIITYKVERGAVRVPPRCFICSNFFDHDATCLEGKKLKMKKSRRCKKFAPGRSCLNCRHVDITPSGFSKSCIFNLPVVGDTMESDYPRIDEHTSPCSQYEINPLLIKYINRKLTKNEAWEEQEQAKKEARERLTKSLLLEDLTLPMGE